MRHETVKTKRIYDSQINVTMTKEIVSVIVPTYNSGAYLEACLLAIKEQTYHNVELIVVDNNSTDETKEIARKYTDKVFNKGPERSAQRNYGVLKSVGRYVLIIDSDMELSKNVVESCVHVMQVDANMKGVVVPEESFGEGFWAQCKKLERSFYVGVSWMEAARFFRRDAFDSVNGYDEDNTGTEDYDLPQRIMGKYGKNVIGRIDDLIYHNEQKLSLIKTCKKKFYYAQKLDAYRSQSANAHNFSKQSSLLERYKLFFSQPKKLFAHLDIGFGMLFMKTSEYASGTFGYLLGIVKNK